MLVLISMLLAACGGDASESGITGNEASAGTERGPRDGSVEDISAKSSEGPSAAVTGNPGNDRDGVLSGVYGGELSLGINAKGELTGYFESGRGGDENGGPMFSCMFFIYGAAPVGNRYEIRTWYPDAKIDRYIGGELTRIEEDGTPGIKVRLDEEHGGCVNVGSTFSAGGGSTLPLTSSGDWAGIRVVSSPKAYFYESSEAKKPRKAYLVERNLVSVLEEADNSVRVAFAGSDKKTTEGWIKKSDFFEHVPAAK